LRTSEALGVAFFEKGQFGIAETVLRRGVDAEAGGDDAKIGLLYWLGRSAEAQDKATDALRYYERALAIDIRFMDLGERVPRSPPDATDELTGRAGHAGRAPSTGAARAGAGQRELRRIIEAIFS